MKLTNDILEEAKQNYFSGKTFAEVAGILSSKFNVAISPETVRKRFVRLDIPVRNNREALKLAKRKHLSIDKIVELYIQQKISLRRLAKQFNSSKATIHKILAENKIIIRNNDEALQLTRKYKRSNFSEDLEELAYLIGLVEGDITAFRKSKHTIRVITNTTHSDFLIMFKQAFEKYGKVRIYPAKNTLGGYMWCISADLDNSFSFLLPKNRIGWILNLNNYDKNIFLYFLAGYFDAEGSLLVKKIRANLQYCLRLGTENIGLLNLIEVKLTSLNFKTLIYRNFSRGKSRITNKVRITYNKDYFALELFRKSDVTKLLRLLPLKHPEKITKKDIILNMIKDNVTRWDRAKPLINQIRTEIKAKTKASVAKAKRLYEAR